MNRYYTSIEESKKLIELGLKAESADMWWLYTPAKGDYIACTHEEPDPHYINRMKTLYKITECAIPCWSVGALLELMPDVIEYNNKHGYYLDIHKRCPYESISDIYIIQYDANIYNVKPKIAFKSNDLIECVYQMIVWILKNNYIKTE